MKLYLDSGEIAEFRKAAATGLLDGATTNPSLIAKSGRPAREVLREVCELVRGPVSAEVIATEATAMASEGRTLRQIAENIVVKVPLTHEGLKACKTLTSEGHPVNVTLCFTAVQAMLAAKMGATYVSPFVGRLDDRSEDGMEVVSEMRQIFDNYGFETEILVASVRHPIHVKRAALLGADIATMPYATFEKLVEHPLTDKGLADFLKDWEKGKK
ncbi:MAG: fructose-6-phosphate aldolase [Planctomycetales bacterium]|nr:fructose-6-phosphate aldolase [Planctomycetales bacterium]